MYRRLFLSLLCAGLVGACEDYNDRDDSGVWQKLQFEILQSEAQRLISPSDQNDDPK